MLTVAEEFLVLTAGDSDDEATLPPITLTKTRLGIKVAMTGASLMELALRDRIETDLEQLWLRDPSPTGEPAVDDVLAGIVAIMPGNAAKMPIDDMIEKLEAIDSYQLALDSLKARGLVRERTERLFRLVPYRVCAVVDRDVVRGIRKRVCDVLFEDEFPSPRDVCLISLLDATRKFRRVVPPERVQEAVERTKRYVNLDLVGRNVANHVSHMIEALSKYGDIV